MSGATSGIGQGSSPRMRGALELHILTVVDGRIIPADAGSTIREFSPNFSARDHPRGCGEHKAKDSKAKAEQGSSPRMRGAPSHVFTRVSRRRIIPADAGSTLHQNPDDTLRGDHPRGCGEHESSRLDPASRGGSSPRMRGAPPPPVGPASVSRIIPADAGSTRHFLWENLNMGGHPRGCGEHSLTTGSVC